MKTIFSDTVIAKMRKLPAFGWVFVLFCTFFFASAYEFLLIGEYTAFEIVAVYDDYFSATGQVAPNINGLTIGIIASLFEAGVLLLIFEIIISFAHNLVLRKFCAQINRSDFKFRLRFAMIIANIIIGILSIGYFFTQKIDGQYSGQIELFGNVVNYIIADNPYYTIQSSILPFAVYSLIFGWFYEDFRSRYVPKRNQANLFSFVASIYVGVNLALCLVYFIYDFAILKGAYSTIQLVASCCEIAIIVIIGILAMLNYKRLKKISTEPEFIFNDENINNDNQHTQKNIFDDFGF